MQTRSMKNMRPPRPPDELPSDECVKCGLTREQAAVGYGNPYKSTACYPSVGWEPASEDNHFYGYPPPAEDHDFRRADGSAL